MDEVSHLPEEVEFSYWFAFFVHDQLVKTLKSAEKADVFNATIDSM